MKRKLLPDRSRPAGRSEDTRAEPPPTVRIVAPGGGTVDSRSTLPADTEVVFVAKYTPWEPLFWSADNESSNIAQIDFEPRTLTNAAGFASNVVRVSLKPGQDYGTVHLRVATFDESSWTVAQITVVPNGLGTAPGASAHVTPESHSVLPNNGTPTNFTFRIDSLPAGASVAGRSVQLTTYSSPPPSLQFSQNPMTTDGDGEANGTITPVGLGAFQGYYATFIIFASVDRSLNVPVVYYCRPPATGANTLVIDEPSQFDTITVSDALSVTVTYSDASGEPISGAVIDWTADWEGATFSPPSSPPTQADGRATSRLSLSDLSHRDPTPVRITAAVRTTQDRVQGTLHVIAEAKNSLAFVEPDPPFFPVDSAEVVCQVAYLDPDGAPLKGKPIEWFPLANNGQFAEPHSWTSDSGIAENTLSLTSWQSGTTPEVPVLARCWTNESDQATTTIIKNDDFAQQRLSIVAPDQGVTQPANTPLRFRARYLGQDGSPLEHKRIDWSTDSDNAEFDTPWSETDTHGYATNDLTVTLAPGANTSVTVTATSNDTPTDTTSKQYRVEAAALQAGTLSIVTPRGTNNGPARSFHGFPLRIVARYLDGGGRPLAGERISWSNVDDVLNFPGNVDVGAAETFTDSNGYTTNTVTEWLQAATPGTNYMLEMELRSDHPNTAPVRQVVRVFQTGTSADVAAYIEPAPGTLLPPGQWVDFKFQLNRAPDSAGIAEQKVDVSLLAPMDDSTFEFEDSRLVTDQFGSAVTRIRLSAKAATLPPDGTGGYATGWAMVYLQDDPNTVLSSVYYCTPGASILRFDTPNPAHAVVTDGAETIGVVYRDAGGAPRPGQLVRWQVESGDASFSPAESRTGSDGRAVSRLTLGNAAGGTQQDISIAATAGANPGDETSATYHFVVQIADNTLEITHPTPGAEQAANQRVQYRARYAASDGSALRQKRIDWSTDTDNAEFDPPWSETNSSGEAISYLTVTLNPGTSEYVTVTAASHENSADTTSPRYRFSAPANQLRLTAPDAEETQPANQPVRYVVNYADSAGNPLRDRPIDWSTDHDDATFAPSMSVTDDQGDAVSLLTVTLASNTSADVHVTAASRDPGGPTTGNDYTFFARGNSLVFDEPDPAHMQPANQPVRCSVHYADSDGMPLREQRIDWSAAASNAQFAEPFTLTDQSGNATNTVTVTLAPGASAPVSITARSHDNGNDAVTQDFTFIASIRNALTLTAPDPDEPQLANRAVEFAVRYLDGAGNPLQGKPIAWSTNQPNATFSNPTSDTDENGEAFNSLLVELGAGDTQTVHVTVESGYNALDSSGGDYQFAAMADTLTIDYPLETDELQYDTRLNARITLHRAPGEALAGQLIRWEGPFTQSETRTGSNGSSTNQLLVETTEGYPGPTMHRIHVEATELDAADERNLHFSEPARNNKLEIEAPDSGDELPFNEWILISARLANEMGNGLARYETHWSATAGARFEHETVDTGPTGIATNYVRYDASVRTTASSHITVSAPQAAATDSTWLYFAEADIVPEPLTVELDKWYAHNPPRAEAVDPERSDQIVTITARRVNASGHPLVGAAVLWTPYPLDGSARFFDHDNTPIPPTAWVNHNQSFVVRTDNDGRATVKIGAMTPWVSYIYVSEATEDGEPAGPSTSVSIVIATFEENPRNPLPPPLLPTSGGGSVTIPPVQQGSQFMVRVPPSVGSSYDTIIVWLKGVGNGETVRMGSVTAAHGGMPFSYSLLTPVSGTYNYVAYLLANSISGTTQSMMVRFTATGNAQNAHPDYTITNRSLTKPHLNGNATVVNNNTIAHGLDVNVPPYPNYHLGDEVTVSIYLNAWDPDTAAPKFNVLTLSKTIDDNAFVDGQPLTFTFPKEELTGYGRSQGDDRGSFEAEYVVKATQNAAGRWSGILDKVVLDTVPPRRRKQAMKAPTRKE